MNKSVNISDNTIQINGQKFDLFSSEEVSRAFSDMVKGSMGSKTSLHFHVALGDQSSKILKILLECRRSSGQ